MGRLTVRRPVTRMSLGTSPVRRPDTLVVEEPLQIRVNGSSLTVTMRTPGDDVDLAHGFLLGEGVIHHVNDVLAARFCAGADGDGVNTYNVLDLTLAPHVPAPDAALARNFSATSSCGVCGKASIDGVRVRSPWPVDLADSVVLSPELVLELPEKLRAAQRVFDSTGGLHAAALADASGALLVVREDVGRHNAVDKVIGWALRESRIPLRAAALVVSGRVSFELVQKALMAGIPMLVAVSAPSSLAVDLATEAGMTLIGFTRGASFVVYAGAHRIPSPEREEA